MDVIIADSLRFLKSTVKQRFDQITPPKLSQPSVKESANAEANCREMDRAACTHDIAMK